MSISQLLKDSFRIAKSNPLIFVPPLAASVFAVLLSLIALGSAVPMVARTVSTVDAFSAGQIAVSAGSALGGVFVVSVISGIVFLIAHGMTVAMANLAIRGEAVTLAAGWSQTLSRIVPVVIASVLVGLIVGVGFLLLVVPGIVVGFLLMFTIVSVMVDGEGPFAALGHSLRTVTKNFGATFVFFLVLIALGVLAGVVVYIVGLIPGLGAVLTMVAGAVFTGYVTVYMVSTYRALSEGSAPDAQA